MSNEERFNEFPKADDPLELEIQGVKAVFRYCPPGKFLMGSPEDEKKSYNDEIQHEVTLTQGFWLLETPVTQELWAEVTGEAPNSFPFGSPHEVWVLEKPITQEIWSMVAVEDWRDYRFDSHPVTWVSWNDCADFVEILNRIGVAPDGFKFDFPTEAEWEYACRAGTTTPFNFGSSLNGDKANCNGNYPYGVRTKGSCLRGTSPVKKYEANAWGFYDMHGNVCEWCKDWKGHYTSEAVTNPQGSSSGVRRVLRGGGWGYYAERCRSASRGSNIPYVRRSDYGFRLALRSAD